MMPFTTELMIQLLEKLRANWPRVVGNPAAQVDVYRNGLRGFSGDAVSAAVDASIAQDEYFPKVARLRELAHKWERANRVEMPGIRDELYCGNCRTRVKTRDRWRPVVDPEQQHAPVLTEDGAYLLLEPYQRDLCECAAPCAYEPIPGMEPPVMEAHLAPVYTRQRAIAAKNVVARKSDAA